mgnify:CR=1 FL=1
MPGVTRDDVLLEDGGGGGGLFATGFLLINDHSRRTVVLAVRGSMHVNDIVTDLACQPTNCSHIFLSTSKENLTSLANLAISEGKAEEVPQAHEGFLQAANELDARLQEEVRRALWSRCTGDGADTEPYELLLCGHSMGIYGKGMAEERRRGEEKRRMRTLAWIIIILYYASLVTFLAPI